MSCCYDFDACDGIKIGADWRWNLTLSFDDAINRQVEDAAMTSGSAVLTSETAEFSTADVGKAVQVEGASAANGTLITTIASYQSATQVTLSAVATATVSNAGLWVYTPVVLTGATAKMQIRAEKSKTGSLLATLSTAGGSDGTITIVEPAGDLAFHLPNAFTDTLTAAEAVYFDIEITQSGIVTRELQGTVPIEAGVTA